MPRQQLIAAVDVGTTKACALLGEVTETGTVVVLGAGLCPSRGMRRGAVANMAATTECIATAVAELEQLCNRNVRSAYVSIAGGQIESQNSRGVTALHRNSSQVQAEDVQRAIITAQALAVPAGRRVIHAEPRRYWIDGVDGIQDPGGMAGQRLEVEAHVVTGAVSSMQNLIHCVEKAGVKTEQLVLQPLASGEALTTESERQLGVVVLDIGGGTTDLAVYLDGTVWHTKVLPLGGRNVTNDIAIGLNVPFGVAERLKLIYGHTLPEAVAGLEPVEAPGFESSRPQRVSQEFLAEIIEARMEELLGLVARELRDLGCQGLIGSGAVLTGGVADQRGIRELATDILGMPVRKGQPHQVEGVSERLMNPTFATGLGLLVWGSRQNNRPPGHYVARRHGPWMERTQRFLRAFFP